MTATVNGMAEVDPEATAAYAHLFHAFADPTRLAIVQHLSTGEHRVRDLVDHMGFAQSTVSKHLGFLAECGLVTVRPEGRASWYALSDPAALGALFSAAASVLTTADSSEGLCVHLRSTPGSRATTTVH